MVYILIAILIFGLLIATHELGHFIAAKCFGVPVLEFSVGMGPALWRCERGGTEYALRILPIGGYCAMAGEDEESDDPNALDHQSFWRKLVIYAAGAGMNFLTGFLIVLVLFSSASGFYTAQIVDLAPAFPQQGEDGIMVGDVIYSVQGERVYMRSDVPLILKCTVLDEAGTLHMVLMRDGEKIERTLTLQTYLDENGEEYTAYGFTYGGLEKANVGVWLKYSWYSTIDLIRTVRLSIKMLLSGQAGVSDLSGPVGIVSAISTVGEESATTADAAYSIAYFAALIAENLAVMNLLPIPALDGGKIFFLLVNAAVYAVTRKRIPEKFENYIHLGGFALLILLMLFVTFGDIVKLIG